MSPGEINRNPTAELHEWPGAGPFASLYVHFPFCEAKCHYCDFYSIGAERTSFSDREGFARALEAETRLASPRLAERIETIFFGGGTPSMTDPEVMERALAPLELSRRVGDWTEWTMEANPSSIERPRLEAYRRLGVNRVSMGVQSLEDETLRKLGRVHSTEGVYRALDAIFEAGFENASVDLLCGVPGQSLAHLEAAVRRLASYPITHLSCYLLTLAKHHPMHQDLPDEETQLEHLLLVDRLLRELGFEHYEISNYCRPGKRARHNLRYWTGESYLGLGPSAHSFDRATARRWKNFSSLRRYGETLARGALPVEWVEALTPEQLRLEEWMLALRLAEGFPIAWLKTPAQRAKADALRGSGFLEAHPAEASRLRLTPRGLALSDQVIAALADERPA